MDSLSRFVISLLIPVMLWMGAWVAGHVFDSPLVIGEKLWLNLGGLLTLVLILLNCLVQAASTGARSLILGVSWFFSAYWWLSPLAVHPLKSPFYVGCSCLLLAWPAYVCRYSRKVVEIEGTGLTPASA